MSFRTDSVHICICQECDIVFRSNEMIRCPCCMKTAIIAIETIDEMFDDMDHREQKDVHIDVYNDVQVDAYSGVDKPMYGANYFSKFVLQMTRIPYPHNYRDQHNQYDQYTK